MAQQSEAGIPRAGKRKWGYDPAQVDEFLEKAHKLYDSDDTQLTQRDIQNVSFDLTKGGYVIAQVDAALSRLERAVVDKRTQWEIAHEGRVTWKARTKELYREISEHAERAERERFAPGRGSAPSYDRRQVDRLTDRIVDKCAAELGVEGAADDPKLDKVTSESVANAVFTQRKGKKGYDERQVDYFLNSCVELLSRIESFDRVADYIGADGDADGSATSLGSHPRSVPSAPSDASPSVPPSIAPGSADGVAPLFADDVRSRDAVDADAPQGFAPAVAPVPAPAAPAAAGNDSFDALSQAEQDLFASAPSFAPASSTTGDAPSFAPAVPVVPTVSAPSAPVAPVPVTPSVMPTPSVVPTVAPASAATLAPAVTSAPAATPAPTVAPAASVTPAPAPFFALASATTPTPAVTPTPAPTTVSATTTVSSEPPAPHLSAPAPATPAHEEKHTTASLAALAQMAEASSQEFPEVTGTQPFAPHMPSLDMPNAFGPSSSASEPPAPVAAPHHVATPTPAAHAPAPASEPVTPAPASVSPASQTPATPAQSAAPEAIPSFAPAVKPARQSVPAVKPADKPVTKPAAAAEPPRPTFSLLSTDGNSDLDIPDLSFPSIDGFDGKKDL